MQAFSATHPFSMNRKLDGFLSERLPDLMDEYKLAQKADLSGIDKDFQTKEKRMEELEEWKNEFELRTKDNMSRIERLKMKYGIKEDG
jgi:predicted  nucleic acid-binding Zn-ribbon protein